MHALARQAFIKTVTDLHPTARNVAGFGQCHYGGVRARSEHTWVQIKQSGTVINLGPGSVVTQMRAQTREWPSSSAVTHAAQRGWRADNERKWLTVVGFRVSGSVPGSG